MTERGGAPLEERVGIDRGSEVLSCRVVGTSRLARDMVEIRMRPPRPVEAEPGQFAMLRPASTGCHPLLSRPMSILDAGEELRFLVRCLGPGTRQLAGVRSGEEVRVLGPIGRGWGRVDERELILVAGGVGLAPLLFAARRVALRGERPTLIYGARTASELVLLEESARVARLLVTTDDGTEGRGGIVTEALEDVVTGISGRAVVWTCGPEAMMAEVARIARAYGHECKVSVEARMACGRGLCLGCARTGVDGVPRYVCKDGPVFDAEVFFGVNAGAGNG